MEQFFKAMAKQIPTGKEQYAERHESCSEMSSALENMVNSFSRPYAAWYDGFFADQEMGAEEKETVKENLVSMALAVIYLFGGANPETKPWVDGRNEMSAARCRYITENLMPEEMGQIRLKDAENLPGMAREIDNIAVFLHTDEGRARFWTEFIRSIDSRFHRTNMQQAIGFLLYCLNRICWADEGSAGHRISAGLLQKYGEDFWRFPLI